MSGHVASRRQGHPSRQVRSGAVGLQDDQKLLGAMPGSAQHLHLMARPWVKRIVDTNQLYELFAGSM
jgi:hypothetical protein